MMGVPFGAAKSTPLCIALKPLTGCLRVPKLDDSLAPVMGVLISVRAAELPFSSYHPMALSALS